VALGHYTHEKSPVGSAAALATISVIERDGLIERARQIEQHVLHRLEAMQMRHPAIIAVRSIGAFFGIELNDGARADRVLYASLKRGLSFKVGGGTVITLCPPLTITDADLDSGLEMLDQALCETER
jgi:4-aminobutyrate aminotransferase